MTVSKIRLPDNTEHDIRAKYLIQSTSSDATSAEFSARTTTEDAIANIQKIYGNTVKFNQQVPNGNFADSDTSWTYQTSGTHSVTNGVLSYVWNGQYSRNGIESRNCVLVASHKYYFAATIKNTASAQRGYYVGQAYGVSINGLFGVGEKKRISGIVAVNTAPGGSGYFFAIYGSTNVDNSIELSDVVAIDITAIYGSGNEPSVSEFEAQYSASYYPYSQSSALLSNSATAIQSKDSSDNIIGNCDLNIPTLTGKLNGAGSSVVIFPGGMKKAGVIQDEVSATATKRVMGIDLGALTWSYNSTLQCFRARNITGMVYTSTNNCICAPYISVTNSEFQLGTDKAVTISARSIFGDGTADIAIRDTSYGSNYSNFKTAMDGVYLYAEMATPQEYILDNALQLQYPVVAGGTEMVLPTSGTAPMKMDVIYGNAEDAAATMSQNFISVDSMKEFLAELGTQMGGIWSMGYENGKHTFTFTSN